MPEFYGGAGYCIWTGPSEVRRRTERINAPERKTGTGDMNTFAHKKSAACVTYGPGLSRTSHTDGEMVHIRDYLGSIEVLKEAIHQLVALSVSSGA